MLQERMQKGESTARSIAEIYLMRIDEIDRKGPALHAIIELNPDALSIADALDSAMRARLVSIGRYALRGVAQPQELFIPEPEFEIP